MSILNASAASASATAASAASATAAPGAAARLIATAIAGYRHEPDQGFCTVCGSVWPCSQAAQGPRRSPVPIPRLATLGPAG